MIIRAFGFLFTWFFLVGHDCAATESIDPPHPQPKVLMYSAVDLHYAADTLEFWGKDVGINGFMLSYLAEWWSSKTDLDKHKAALKRLNSVGQQYGIDSNFINVALGYNLPLWTDDKAWKGIIDSFKNIAELAKETGSKGISLDTEPYIIALYDSSKLLDKSTTREQMRAKVYLRGQQIMQALTTAYPDIEVIILPEGAFYWFNDDQRGDSGQQYELWIDFYNGIASVKNKRGLILASERSYEVTDRNFLTNINSLVDTTMKTHANDPSFWHQHCSIALGMWPLGKEYDNKAPRYSPALFKTQFTQAVQLSPKYVWIYGHGSAWYQLKPGDVARYNANNRLWAKDYQILPTTQNIDAYYSVLRDYKNRLHN